MSKKGIFIPDMDKERYDAIVKTIDGVLYFTQYALVIENMKSAEEIEIPDEKNEPEDVPMTCRKEKKETPCVPKQTMTAKRWIYAHKPEMITHREIGVVVGCPGNYSELKALGIRNHFLDGCYKHLNPGTTCEDCWGQELHGEKGVISFRDWITKYKPDAISGISLGGIWGCPHSYPELVKLGASKDPILCARLNACGRCWDRPILKKEEE